MIDMKRRCRLIDITMLPLMLMHVRIKSAAEKENYVSGVKECTAKMEDFIMRYRSDLLT